MKATLQELEAKVVQLLLAGESPALEVLRKQYSSSSVLSRKLTGCGFFSHLSVSPTAPVLDGIKRMVLSDVVGRVSDKDPGSTFALFIHDGRIHVLEGATAGDSWPEDIEILGLSYRDGPNRDMPSIRRDLNEADRVARKVLSRATAES